MDDSAEQTKTNISVQISGTDLLLLDTLRSAAAPLPTPSRAAVGGEALRRGLAIMMEEASRQGRR